MDQSRRSRKRAATHQSLMHSAKILYEENGLGNVTIDRIAENADVSRSTFFSHFESIDDMLSQIANQEIIDIATASKMPDGSVDITKAFKKLNEDTFPYPYLMSELVVRSILSGKESSISELLTSMSNTISEKVGDLPEGLSAEDVTSVIFGAYFGLVFKKFVYNEKFENPDEVYDKIHLLLNYFKYQEEPNNE